MSLLRSKVGLYCGAFSDSSQPLFPIGMKTPIFMGLVMTSSRCRRGRGARAHTDTARRSVAGALDCAVTSGTGGGYRSRPNGQTLRHEFWPFAQTLRALL